MKKEEQALLFLEELRQCLPKPFMDDVNKVDKGIHFVVGYLMNHQAKEVVAGDIAKEMNVSTARVAALLNKMSKQDLIIRATSSKDARKTIVKLTTKGITKGQKDRNALIKKTLYLMDEVGEEELKQFIEISKKMKEVIAHENL